jgi:hypothetical protein
MQQPLSRKEKEALYVQMTSKLMRKWSRKVSDADYGDYTQWSDQELDDTLKIAREQLRFERGWAVFAGIGAIGIGVLLSYIF